MPWSAPDLEAFLALAAEMERPGFVPGHCVNHPPVEKDGVMVHQMPYWAYGSEVSAFMPLCFSTSLFIDPYAVLPEDPPGSEPNTTLFALFPTPHDFKNATIDQLRRYFVLCVRGERFCEGLIAGQMEKGCFHAAVSRVRELTGRPTQS